MTVWHSSSVARLILAFTLTAAFPLAAKSQDVPLPAAVQGEVTPQTPRRFAVRLAAGDVTFGTLELVHGAAVGFEVYDPQGKRLKDEHADVPGVVTVGFAAPNDGTYRVEIARVDLEPGDTAPGTFVLIARTMSPAQRMAGVQVDTVVRYQSPLIMQLAADMARGSASAVAKFWADAASSAGPLVEPFDQRVPNLAPNAADDIKKDFVLVTFLWRERYETHNVRVDFPQQDRAGLFMTRVPGTDVWYKTMLLHRSTRIAYTLSPNAKPGESFTAQSDPLNPHLAWEEEPQYSLLELAGAPDESPFRAVPSMRGTLKAQQSFASTLLKADRPIQVYTPAGYAPGNGPYPLLLIFDGVTYIGGFKAVPTLDNLIASGRIRPVIACFLTSRGTRASDLGDRLNPTFADAVATELVPWLRSQYAISRDPKDVIIGGYSAGGSGAARIAFRHPEVFGNVLAQSAAFAVRFETHPTIIEFRDAKSAPIRFYLEVGLYENLPVDLPANEAALTEGMTASNRHFRDVLIAKGYDVTYRETGGTHNNLHFRSMFADGLLTLLPPTGTTTSRKAGGS